MILTCIGQYGKETKILEEHTHIKLQKQKKTIGRIWLSLFLIQIGISAESIQLQRTVDQYMALIFQVFTQQMI